jgi:hypothetical protein
LEKDSVSIWVNEDMGELLAKIPERFMKIVDRAITLAIEEAPGEPQLGEPSQAPKFDDDFASSALSIHNKVRAFDGARDFPKGALAKVEGETLCFVKTRIEENPKLSASKKIGHPRGLYCLELTICSKYSVATPVWRWLSGTGSSEMSRTRRTTDD